MDIYSRTVVEHFMQPRRTEPIARVDGSGEARSQDADCPDHVTFRVHVEGDAIVAVQQVTEGCVATVAAASYLADTVVGTPVAAALRITAADVKQGVGGIPARHVYCADVPVDALHRALDDARGHS